MDLAEELARELAPNAWRSTVALSTVSQQHRRTASLRQAKRILSRLDQLGYVVVHMPKDTASLVQIGGVTYRAMIESAGEGKS